MKKKYIIKQIPAEYSDPEPYFDDDYYKDEGEVFILHNNECLFNQEDWKALNEEYNEYLEEYGFNENEVPITGYLGFKTCSSWSMMHCAGYCQGDYVDIIYNEAAHSEDGIRMLGDMWLGCYQEFSVTYPNGDTIYGFYVTDTESIKTPHFQPNEEYKQIVCQQAEIPYDETALMMIVGQHTVYDYEEF